MTERSRNASEGYIYLLNTGKIYFARDSNIEFRDGREIIAGHHTPLKNSTKSAEKMWIDQIVADYFDSI